MHRALGGLNLVILSIHLSSYKLCRQIETKEAFLPAPTQTPFYLPLSTNTSLSCLLFVPPPQSCWRLYTAMRCPLVVCVLLLFVPPPQSCWRLYTAIYVYVCLYMLTCPYVYMLSPLLFVSPPQRCWIPSGEMNTIGIEHTCIYKYYNRADPAPQGCWIRRGEMNTSWRPCCTSFTPCRISECGRSRAACSSR